MPSTFNVACVVFWGGGGLKSHYLFIYYNIRVTGTDK